MSISQEFNLNLYIDHLTAEYPSIKAIWLIGSRTNNTFQKNSDWDLLIFANQEILNFLKLDTKFKKDNVDLLVVYDQCNFESPWLDQEGNRKTGNLEEWKWNELNAEDAKYESSDEKEFDDDFDPAIYTPKSKIQLGKRIWPPKARN